MSKYTLTTDLIADCMALIPQNIDLLNENTDLRFWLNEDDEPVFGFFGKNIEPEEFKIFSHCLRTIPEFQAENPIKKQIAREIELGQLVGTDDLYYDGRMDALYELMPQTIASATLYGQGEFPPSTLEELCESYKNVMSK